MVTSLLQCSYRPSPDVESAALERLWRNSSEPYLESHPIWATLDARSAGVCLHTFTASKNGEIVSYAFVKEGRGALSWALGEASFYRKSIERLHLSGGQVFADEIGPDERREGASELLAWLAREAQGRPIFLQSLRSDSPLAQIVRSGKHPFMVVSHGTRYHHFSIDLPGSMNEFYQSLGYKTRRSVRNSLHRLERELAGRLELKCFSRPKQVADFLDHAMPISEKTYQYRLLRTGLRDRIKRETEFRVMSELGWWRGYILYCQDEPSAFGYGYWIENTFYYWDMGYDPKWSQRSVGTITLLKLIEILITADNPPARFDFLYGNAEYKERFSNRSCEEESIYLFPYNFTNFFVAQSLQVTNMLSDKAGRILDRYNLKSRVKRFFRRRAVEG